MEKVRDIVMKAFPDKGEVTVDFATERGGDFFLAQYRKASVITILADQVNDFMEGLREQGLTFSFRLGEA